jgi:hypothetical protein
MRRHRTSLPVTDDGPPTAVALLTGDTIVGRSIDFCQAKLRRNRAIRAIRSKISGNQATQVDCSRFQLLAEALQRI